MGFIGGALRIPQDRVGELNPSAACREIIDLFIPEGKNRNGNGVRSSTSSEQERERQKGMKKINNNWN